MLKFLPETEQLPRLFWHKTEQQRAGPSGHPRLLLVSAVGDVIVTILTIREKGAGGILPYSKGRCKMMLKGCKTVF